MAETTARTSGAEQRRDPRDRPAAPSRPAPSTVAGVTDATVPVDLGVIQPRRRLGSSDLRVFPMAIGGNVFGWTADLTETESVLDAYYDLGGNFVDTADS